MRFELTTFTLARLERSVANLQELAVYDAAHSTLHKRLHKATRWAKAEWATGWRAWAATVATRRPRRTVVGPRWPDSIRPPHGERRRSVSWTIPLAWRFNVARRSAVEALLPTNRDRHPWDTEDALAA